MNLFKSYAGLKRQKTLAFGSKRSSKKYQKNERQTGMNVKFFNGSVEDTFDFVLTALVAEKKNTDEILPDSDFFKITIKSTSKLTRETIRLMINFFTMDK